MPEMPQANLQGQQLEERERQSPTRTHISQLGWAIITLLLVLGAINFADKAVLGLAAGNDAIQGLHNAYVLAALLLLVEGVLFTTVVRPEKQDEAGEDGRP